ncbi:response regulator [Rhizobium sp. P28RR-XV]|uniref:response regulator n=1 Tax=Rhizobium sp. P28RR-XV TaxID=2726737 RepID=UPI0014573079|nr:response regulator [Rhizobium sp. P28RR-XV]NLR85428.1 response regulator [Rhizobium sp. P28RR-XV]
MRILVVEDELLIGLDMEYVLRSLGYEVAGPVTNAADARKLGATVDIALVDVNLSDGPTGPTSAAYLRQTHGVTIIFTTANPEAVIANSDAIGVLSKPVSASDLLSAIEYAIACRKGEPAVAPTCLKHA